MPILQFVYRKRRGLALAATLLVLGGCSGGTMAIDRPRSLVVPSGARIQPDSVRLDSVNVWVQEMERAIQEDPSFWVIVDNLPQAAYPWETLEIPGDDSVRVAIEGGSDASLPYMIYGFLHLMRRVDRMDEWFPEASGLEGFDLERFILARTADAWLLGRSVFDTAPYGPLDELIYAYDRGYLEHLILSARPEEFAETREAWVRENPDGLEELRAWYRQTFDKDPPGSPPS